jgi:hypothetical protein
MRSAETLNSAAEVVEGEGVFLTEPAGFDDAAAARIEGGATVSAAMRIVLCLGRSLLGAAHAANNAAFVSQNVPAVMVPGQVYAVSERAEAVASPAEMQ